MADTTHDLVVTGGTVVTAGSVCDADIGITGGRVAQVGGRMHGGSTLDAAGAFVLPGGVDMHVHLAANAPDPDGRPDFVDTFASGTRSAAAGGVTTVGVMTLAEPGQRLVEAVGQYREGLRAQAVVDWIMHPGVIVTREDTLTDVAALAAAGHRSFKVFTISFDLGCPELVDVVAAAGAHGMLTMVHCEDQALIQFSAERLRAEGRGGLADYPSSRPVASEVAAVQRAVAICEVTSAPIYLVHLSSRRALDVARRARARGLPVFVETRPMYLHLDQRVHAEADGAKYFGQPPVRTGDDNSALWDGIVDGSVHTLGSDHAPWLLAHKTDPALDVTTVRPGVAELETMLPTLYTYGVATGRITLERFVSLTATNPARLFGLYPRKGTIAVGADADLVVLDPHRRRPVDGRSSQSRSDYSIYDGQSLVGWPRFTVSRGEVVWSDSAIAGSAGRGREVTQGPWRVP